MNYRNPKLAIGVGLGLLSPLPIVAHATVYLSEDQAVQLMFPSEKLARKEITLTPEQKSAIEKTSGETVRSTKLIAYVAPNKDTVFIDQVLGKHEFITIAVGVAADGSVRGIEILEYRETYGSQVRTPEWRQQFVGKNASATLKVNSDIKNISGATLSSVHVTGGVRRLIKTYESLRAQL
ncbi:MAG: FMN-binding protein [Oligoflexia bacterium]|nr:FMN-binding protein [Oligoflexia bacterium]